MTFDRILWWVGSIAWLVFFGLAGITGLVEENVLKIGLAAQGLLCLAIAADVRTIRLGMEDRET